MTFGGNGQTDKKWTNHVPILWKRKVKSLIKSNRQNALTYFFENLKEDIDPKRMKYGLELLLPTSFNYIVKSLKKLEARESFNFLELLTTESFLSNIDNLEKKYQKNLLDQIYQNSLLDLVKEETIGILISKLDVSLVDILYDRITEKSSDKEIQSFIRIIKLWGKINEEINLLVLKNYFKKQKKPIENYS